MLAERANDFGLFLLAQLASVGTKDPRATYQVDFLSFQPRQMWVSGKEDCFHKTLSCLSYLICSNDCLVALLSK